MVLSAFHPAVRRWFETSLGPPTRPQVEGWPAIRDGRHTLIAAPTGSGKTLAAFLCAIDSLLQQGAALPDETQVLYVSPLKALGNDVQKNLAVPLQGIGALDPSLPAVRVVVRSGDTPSSERARMVKRPPHVLVTTPESLYILLTSDGGRNLLRTVRTVIVDEVHAVLGSKRGSHLALSLERLAALCGEVQRIGLSATQKPLADVARFLVGADRTCHTVDAGHLRQLDLGLEVPGSELSAVCSHEVWDEIYDRIVELVEAHRTTLVFVNTRKLAERVAARLSDRLGKDAVTSHHGSLSRERRLDAEQRLKSGSLRALVATASLELGIDIGDVDMVVQVGVTSSIAAFLQRVGRAGHGIGRVPKGRLFPLTMDELVCGAALLRSVHVGELDRTPQPAAPLDILAQHVVSACVAETWEEAALLACFRRAWPYRHLAKEDFDRVVALHTEGRSAYLHRDGVGGRLRGTRRARIPTMTGGGAIPDTADYQVVLQPEGTVVGSLHEDFAIESNVGDIFQLGNTSWRILRVEPGIVRVASAEGLPPTLPFWIAEGPARSRELSASVAQVREAPEIGEIPGLPAAATDQLRAYLEAGTKALGAQPTQQRIVLERFFDEADGMQIVVHSPFGGRINRAFGLALRKRFCRSFGFELQAAANEEALLLSLGPQQSFPLAEVARYLHPNTARQVLIQALLDSPMFQTRWRWNVTRALVVSRTRGGQRVPAPLLRFRAEDALAQAFPQVAACAENLAPGDLDVPMDHPLVQQTIEDCLHEAMDVEGLIEVLAGIHDGSVDVVAVDRPEPSPFAEGILNAMPYAFLDDTPLEERRSQAVLNRRAFHPAAVRELGELDADAVQRVCDEAWPDPRDVEELHEALLWMGFVAETEVGPWRPWLEALRAKGRAVLDGDRWFAAEAEREPLAVQRGRLEALGPIHSDDPLLLQLEGEGVAVRVTWQGREAWCNRRLLARIHRYTVERLRQEIAPVAPNDLLRFLACWQHAAEGQRLEGPAGTEKVLRQLAGLDVPAAAWESAVLRTRVRDYSREDLDQLTLAGAFAWGRLWGNGACAVRSAPICVVPRGDLPFWLALAGRAAPDLEPDGEIAQVLDLLRARGAMFPLELQQAASMLPSRFEDALRELVARGAITCDSFAGLRQLLVPARRRRFAFAAAGRWSCFGGVEPAEPPLEWLAERLLDRWGVVFRRVLRRERFGVPWRDLLRVFRRLELEGRVRGGRFVTGFDGEQFALPEAVKLLRKQRQSEGPSLEVAAADPLNLSGILTPDERVSPLTRRKVAVG
ncbi:MAG: DEAD/DEAH box helicase [Planctomycetota bacterium]